MSRSLQRLLGLILLFCTAASTASEPWRNPMYLPGDGYWQQRFRVQVQNGRAQPLEGWPVSVAMPPETAGTPAQAVRLCNASGQELLFNLLSAQGEPVSTGPIPAGTTMTIPVECAASQSAVFWVYFDNRSAWEVPDMLSKRAGLLNGDVEQGSGDRPAGWTHDAGDEQHRATWCDGVAQSGCRSLKTVVSTGAEHTWISTRQPGIAILGGAKYRMRAWVKADQVKGQAGWYIHVGTAKQGMLISPMLMGGGGTYDWKQVQAEFTAPESADRASVGTVLRGTGTAWFDNVSLECQDFLEPAQSADAERSSATRSAGGGVEVKVDRPERMDLRVVGRASGWLAEAGRSADRRAVIQACNFGQEARGGLVCVDVARLNYRLHGCLRSESLRLFDGDRPVPFVLSGQSLLFQQDLPGRTLHRWELYFSEQAGQAATGTAPLALESRNLAANGSFESGTTLPEGWMLSGGGKAGEGPVFAVDSPGAAGQGDRCAKFHVPAQTPRGWRGWTQRVAVHAGREYLVSAWIKAQDLSEGTVGIHLHLADAQGKLCRDNGITSVGPNVRGTGQWTHISRILRMPDDAASMTLHLTMNQSGTLWHDGVLVAEVTSGSMVALEGRPVAGEGLKVWPLNPIVKVFPDEPVPAEPQPVSLLLAANEKEALQLCVRSGKKLARLRVELEPLAGPGGARLDDLQIDRVGYVPIDYPTNYYQSDSPAWHRKVPTRNPGCDGWTGLWPDPLLPLASLDLEPNFTQAVWITIGAGAQARPGQYTGRVRLVQQGQELAAVPVAVRVADFSLPEERHVAAIYDVRLGNREHWGGSEREWHAQVAEFMGQRRLCGDHIRPEPEIRYVEGRVQADFTAFDEAAERHFGQWKMPFAYMPHMFYLFGWGHPPGKKFGEWPYPGEPPFEGADRAKLRPEFKTAYQACLRAFWEHVQQKGWQEKFVFYISDEPYDRHEHIRQQMKALCDMVHEVDRAIPIYSSTWHYVPDWQGYLDVWGIGHYGVVLPEKMAELKASGARIWFTTDGQMCTDTPLCATERLLPHYCWKYGAQAYEFWGVGWLTYDPYRFGWHSYIHQSGEPGKTTWVRYPNGDGFLLYPGKPIGREGPISSIRLEQAREGVEDYEYLWLLNERLVKAKQAGRDTSAAEAALAEAARLVEIPNAGGRYTSRNLNDPDEVLRVKRLLGTAIEQLGAR